MSRRFVKATKARLVEFRSRPLDDRRWAVVYIDGFGFGEETMVGALGVDDAGNKVPLTVMQGTTENKTVVTRLLNNLEERGLTADDGLLFVIDGGKALFWAIKGKFGDQALIQRCRQHKLKNVIDLLPGEHHTWVRRDLRRAWALPDAGDAERALRALVAKIARTHPDAAASLEEGLAETITINRLGIDGTLAHTLATTNPMESTVDIVRARQRPSGQSSRSMTVAISVVSGDGLVLGPRSPGLPSGSDRCVDRRASAPPAAVSWVPSPMASSSKW